MPKPGTPEWNTIIQRLRQNDITLTKLDKLDLGFNPIDTAGAKEIASALKKNLTLTQLILDCSAAGVKDIASALKDNRTLTRLDMSHCGMKDAGAKEIASALKTNCTLTRLDLGFNHIGNMGVKEIASALKVNCTLTQLDLTNNWIGDVDVKDIASALKDNHTLTSLNLGFCYTSNEGAKEIASALKENHTLTNLCFYKNHIGDAGAKEIASALKDNCTLTELELRDNEIKDWELANVIATCLQGNKQLRDQLHQAVKEGNLTLTRQLLVQGVSLLSVTGNDHNTSLHWAIIQNQPTVAAWLLQEMQRQGIPINQKNRQGKTAANLAMANPTLAALFQQPESIALVKIYPPIQSDTNNNNTHPPQSVSPTPSPSPSSLLASLPHQLQTIPWQSLQREETPIGSGGFGEVYRATWYGQTVAVKQLYLKTLSADISKEFQQEVNLMSGLHFPNVVHLLGICLEPGHYALVMEYLPKGSLNSVLHDQRITLPWQPLRWQIAIGIAQGLAYLHSQHIVHQDLKSLNVLLDQNWIPKIADFGLSRIKLETTSSTSLSQSKNVGSVRWRAPELFKRGAKPNFASDVYSLGMVYWEIASRQLPYSDGLDDATVISWIKDGEQETLPSDCPSSYGQVIRACWSSADKRPLATEILDRLQKALAAEAASIVKSWHFATEVKNTIPENNNNNTSSYQLLQAAPSDVQKVMNFYQHHPVPNMDIKQIQVIYNPAMNRAFALRMELLQARKNQPAFAPKWSQKSEAADQQTQRQKTTALAQSLSQPHLDSDYSAVNLLPLWHGTKKAVLPSLFTTGYANLATTDSGFFGKGIYSAHEAEYAYRVYGKDGILVMNWVAYFSAYPVVRSDMSDLMSKGSHQNYDANFVPVVPANPNNPNETNYFPCQPGQSHRYIEVVVFESAQCLPRYLIELQPSLPAAPSLLPAQPQTNKKNNNGNTTNTANYPQNFFAAKTAAPPINQPATSFSSGAQQGSMSYYQH